MSILPNSSQTHIINITDFGIKSHNSNSGATAMASNEQQTQRIDLEDMRVIAKERWLTPIELETLLILQTTPAIHRERSEIISRDLKANS